MCTEITGTEIEHRCCELRDLAETQCALHATLFTGSGLVIERTDGGPRVGMRGLSRELGLSAECGLSYTYAGVARLDLTEPAPCAFS